MSEIIASIAHALPWPSVTSQSPPNVVWPSASHDQPIIENVAADSTPRPSASAARDATDDDDHVWTRGGGAGRERPFRS